jgi:hypothetical protein
METVPVVEPDLQTGRVGEVLLEGRAVPETFGGVLVGLGQDVGAESGEFDGPGDGWGWGRRG